MDHLLLNGSMLCSTNAVPPEQQQMPQQADINDLLQQIMNITDQSLDEAQARSFYLLFLFSLHMVLISRLDIYADLISRVSHLVELSELRDDFAGLL
ncbi:unnamed protein product [Soboliphyme baturini]|uniref:Uncharacterized protein n=1 Tax=Soboliphyme baturini TaxID=241478 RepID=A0A183JA35_9BILA|nr:unnamed protein product [Soboliphyme baturini]